MTHDPVSLACAKMPFAIDLNYVPANRFEFRFVLFFSTFFRPVVCELTGRDLPFRIALMMSDGTKGEALIVREEK